MNVFVLCTGRSGSNTFMRACRHISNFTVGHESRAQKVGDARLDYPPNHIEIDNRLSWVLGRLDERFGDDARYVHLTRDEKATAQSFSERFEIPGSMGRAYRNGILVTTGASKFDACLDMVRTVNSNIRLFLRDKTHTMNFPLADAVTLWPGFWAWVGAEGDCSGGKAEFLVPYNKKETPDRRRSLRRLVQRVRREVLLR